MAKNKKATAIKPTTNLHPSQPLAPRHDDCVILELYIAGLTPRSTLAVERIRTICDLHLAGRYELTIIDLFLHPELAQPAQIVVVPTLIKQAPVPIRQFIGDMADEKKIISGLNIVA